MNRWQIRTALLGKGNTAKQASWAIYACQLDRLLALPGLPALERLYRAQDAQKGYSFLV